MDAQHRALGARMAEFGGWEMPISYSGVLEEHRACREEAVVFDVSHLGSVQVQGPGAIGLLQWAFTNDLGRIAPGRAQYTHLLDPIDAHVLDDIIVWWLATDSFLVMPNASNTTGIVEALGAPDALAHANGAVTSVDITASRAVLAVQGPRARERLATISKAMAEVNRFNVKRVNWNGVECVVAGTGYTGEDGVEVHLPIEQASALWIALLDAGMTPAGLGARDTLRLEAGLPLHGHELGEGITPLQASLGWVVRWDKGDFRGKDALADERDLGPKRRLCGLTFEGRRPPREGYPVLRNGEIIGAITSGNFSPTLGHAIALALLIPDVEEGMEVSVDVRGDLVSAVAVKPPFVRRGTLKN